MPKFFLVLVIFIVSACATGVPKSQISNAATPDGQSVARGVIVGSFTQIGKTYVRSISFRHIASGKSFTIAQGTFLSRNDFKGNIDGIGIVFAYELPVGEYEFFDYEISYNDGLVSKVWRPQAKFSIPFEVNGGKINYLGDIRLIPSRGKNFLGLAIDAGGAFLFANELERDLPIIRRRFSHLLNEDVNPAVPTSGDISGAAILFE